METPRLSQPKPVLWRAEWLVVQDESRSGLLMESCDAVNADSLSTMTMGVEHFGQRKRVGWAREAPVTAGEIGEARWPKLIGNADVNVLPLLV